jgi:hypothetical protein
VALIGFVLPIVFGGVLRRRMVMRKDAESSAVD